MHLWGKSQPKDQKKRLADLARMRDNPAVMSPSRRPVSPLWLGIGAFAGTFLLIPLWDLYALLYMLRADWRAPLLRRLARLAAAFGLALIGLGRVNVFRSVHLVAETAVVSSQWFASLRTLMLATIIAAPLIVAVLGLMLGAGCVTRRYKRLGASLESLIWAASGLMAAPVGGLALAVLLVLGVRLHVIPVGLGGAEAESLRSQIAPALLIAMMPSLVAVQAGLQRWTEARQRGAAPDRLWALLGLEVSRAFTGQAGWLLGSLVVVEAVLGLNGIGRVLRDALLHKNGALFLGTSAVLAPVLLAARLRTVLTYSVQQALLGEPEREESTQVPKSRPQLSSGYKLRLAIMAGGLLLVLAGSVWPSLSPSRYATRPDPSAIYLPRSSLHPLGTDHLGRDVLGQIVAAQRSTWGLALTGGAAALAFGGAWGVGSRAITRRWGPAGRTLADLLLVPAEAAILTQPVLVGLLAASFSDSLTESRFPALGLGAGLGLLLAPRLAWMLGDGGYRPSGQMDRRCAAATALAVFAAATFAALQYSLAAGMLNAALPPVATLGTLLSHYEELTIGEAIILDGRFVRLALYDTAPGVLLALSVWLAQAALTDLPSSPRESILSHILA